MVEGGAAEATEAELIDALMFAHEAAQPILELIEKIRAAVGKPKQEFKAAGAPADDQGARRRARRRRPRRPRSRSPTRRRATTATGAQEEARRDARSPSSGAEKLVPVEELIKAEFEERKAHVVRTYVLDEGRRIDGRGHAEHPPDHVRGGPPPARARLGAVPARRDAGDRHHHARHRERRAEDRRPDRRDVEALLPPLQLPALLHRRDQADRAAPAGARSATARSPSARCARDPAARRSSPTRSASCREIAGVERLVVDGGGLRRLPLAHGRGRADQGARSPASRWASSPSGDNARACSQRHPRRRGPPRRHGLQGLRHRAAASPRSRWTSRSPASTAQILAQALEQAREGRPPHPRQDARDAAAPRARALASTRRASPRSRSSPTRSASSSAPAARPSRASSSRPASPSTSRTTAR